MRISAVQSLPADVLVNWDVPWKAIAAMISLTSVRKKFPMIRIAVQEIADSTLEIVGVMPAVLVLATAVMMHANSVNPVRKRWIQIDVRACVIRS